MSDDEKCPHGYRAPCPRCIEESPISRALWADINAPRDWPTFWQSLTPAEVAEALRAAPKVAGPWQERHGTWRRFGIRNDDDEAVAEATPDERFHRFYLNTEYALRIGCSMGRGSSLEEAKRKADVLLSEEGWILE